MALPVTLYLADIGMSPRICSQRRCTLNASSTFSSDGHRSRLHIIAHRDGHSLQQRATEDLKLILLLHSRFERRLHRCVFVLFVCHFLSLPGLHQVSLRSASGQRSVRHATPRWAPTFLMSPSSSLNLVHFIPPLSIRPQQSHMYLTATGAIYVAVLVLEVWTFAAHSFLFNIFLDMVSRN